MKYFILIAIVILLVISSPGPTIADNDNNNFVNSINNGTGEGRFCFGCLVVNANKTNSEYPWFDIKNLFIDKETGIYGPCNFHSIVRCPNASSPEDDMKCFLKANSKGKLTVEKGCMKTTEKDGCYPPTSKDKQHPKDTQYCVCSKRFCNRDLLYMGGSETLSNKVLRLNGGMSIRVEKAHKWLTIVTLVLLTYLHAN